MEKLSEDQIKENLKRFPEWEFNKGGIEATLQFGDFKDCFAMMTRIAFECEKQGHHPNWYNVYNRLTIRLSTHDAGGVTEKDFKLAEAIETLIANQ